MAVFIPICFIDGTTGKFYSRFGLTMAVAVCISTFNALTFSPALCVLLMKVAKREKKTAHIADAYSTAFHCLTNRYKRSIVFFLRHKWLAAALLAVAVSGFFCLLSVTKTGLVPDEDTGTIVVDVQSAPGTSLSQTEQILKKIEERMQDTPQFQIYSKSVGMGMLAGRGTSNGTFIIRLKPWEERKGKHDDNRSVINDMYRRLSDITDARIMVFAQPIIAGYGVTNGFEIHIQDRRGGSIEELQQHTQAFIAALNECPEISTRLRPILMTSLTMIFGLIPMLFSTGVGCNGSRSLGVGTVGGMIVGTLSLLLFVPFLFAIFKHIEERIADKAKIM